MLIESEKSIFVPVEPELPQKGLIRSKAICILLNDIPVGRNSTIQLFAHMTIKSTIDRKYFQQNLDKLPIRERQWRKWLSNEINVTSVTHRQMS